MTKPISVEPPFLSFHFEFGENKIEVSGTSLGHLCITSSSSSGVAKGGGGGGPLRVSPFWGNTI